MGGEAIRGRQDSPNQFRFGEQRIGGEVGPAAGRVSARRGRVLYIALRLEFDGGSGKPWSGRGGYASVFGPDD